jgi:menaquinone-specific isochorismate synthase
MDSMRSESRPATAGEGPIVVRGCPVDDVPIRTLLTVFDRPRLGWADETATLVGGGAVRTVTAHGPSRFETVRERADAVFERLRPDPDLPAGARPRLFGGFAFTDSRAERARAHPWHGFPPARFTLPAVQFSITDDGAWLTTAATGQHAASTARARLDRWHRRIQALPDFAVGEPPGTRGRTADPGKERWDEQVTAAVSQIRAGDLQKVVLAQSLGVTLEQPVTVSDVLTRLGTTYPDCYRFLFESATGSSFFGATPERLVRLRGEAVETEALAGSIGRGETDEEDEWLATQLRESTKNNHEHDLVVEAVCDQLEALTDAVETGPRSVRKLANVQHLETPIRASLGRSRHVLELVEALHPTPAVGGLPPDRALETISETEAFDRGWYAAPVGWFDEAGDGSFAVAIRSAVTAGTDASLFAGAGIVGDSDPDQEYDELQLKYQPMLDELE